ncbi:hypothetical protein BD414DRAFT_473195 [Trametes punicea]|nr:hypothetical protein BD414DRAFT_473195 [Trametes punicea]
MVQVSTMICVLDLSRRDMTEICLSLLVFFLCYVPSHTCLILSSHSPPHCASATLPLPVVGSERCKLHDTPAMFVVTLLFSITLCTASICHNLWTLPQDARADGWLLAR